MKPTLFKQAAEVWTKVSEGDTIVGLKFELEVHKKLLNFFQVGDYYFFIFNLHELKFDLMSSEIESVLGYKPNNITVPQFLSLIHPEDEPYFISFEKKVVEFISKLNESQIPNYKVRSDYRVKKANGAYIRILQQIAFIEFGAEKNLLRTFIVHTDITHLKEFGRPVLSFIGMNGEPSYIDVKIDDVFPGPTCTFSEREKEVLRYLIEGKSSKEIADELFISHETVKTHRRHLLQKSGTKNSLELVRQAVINGWI
jgi:DNA-binding CsgD family transcriptional regulator